jgi:hypothetical protein
MRVPKQEGILIPFRPRLGPVRLTLCRAFADVFQFLIIMIQAMRYPTKSNMHACLTPPPNSIGQLKSSSKHFRPRSTSPSSDSTSDSSEDELYRLPGLPPLRNLSRYVQRAKSRFKPYDRNHGHGPDAIELRFFRRSVGEYSGETELNLADVQAVC